MKRTRRRTERACPTVNESEESECEREGETSTTKRFPEDGRAGKGWFKGGWFIVRATEIATKAETIAPRFVIARMDLIRHIGQILFLPSFGNCR